MRKDLRQSIQRRARQLLYGTEPLDSRPRHAPMAGTLRRPLQANWPTLPGSGVEPGKRRCRVHGGKTPPRTDEQKQRQREVSQTWHRGPGGIWRSATTASTGGIIP